MHFIKYILSYTIPISVLASFQGGLWSYAGIIYAFGVLPIAELVLPVSQKNLDKKQEQGISSSHSYDLILWSMVPIQFCLLTLYCHHITDENLTIWEQLGMTLSMGTACGVLGINVAHELGHRRTWYEQKMALALLMTSLYMHFFIEHNRVHHRYVATPKDPASAKKNQNVYSFIIQSVSGSLLSSYKLAKSETILYLSIQFIFIICIGFIFNFTAAMGVLSAGVFGFVLLEIVNYIEHYGLSRKQNSNTGRFEKVQPSHSWNSNNPLGRIVLFELSRHSDHHANAQRKYQILRHFDEAPQMPTGYPGMMLLSLVPPLWFKIMHKRLT